MKRIHYTNILFAILIAFSSCSESYLIDNVPEQIVIEGYIKDNDFPLVMLTTSIGISMEEKDIRELYDHIGSWGKVAISDGDTTIILTGRYDTNFYPPYIYTTTSMTGKCGRKYTITVDYKEHHATATTTIPETVILESVTQRKVEGNDTLWTLEATFTDPPQKQYYCFFNKVGQHTQQYMKCDIGSFDDTAINNNPDTPATVTYPIYRSKDISNYLNHSEYFVSGDTVCVELCTMDRQSHLIWSDYQNSNALSSNAILPFTRSIRSNVDGGYGYWCGYGASRKTIIVGE